MKQIATAMLAVGTMLAALSAAGADAICPPNPPVGSTVNGNLIVPPGATCLLNHVTVTGNVDVQPQAELNVGFDSALPQPSSTIDGNVYVGKGATLVASSGISLDLTLGGNIEANQCNTVLLGPVIIGGNVDIQNCTGAESGYETAQIGGNFTCDDNSRCLAAFGQVRGNMQINDNAEADVGNNTVGGNLRCQRNAAVFGSGNTVGGHKQGQCAGL